MTTVACVLKSGGRYDWSWVHRLRSGILRHHPNVRFACLTDMPDGHQYGVDVIPLLHDLPGWWSKIELFRPDAFTRGQVVYLDLDVVVFREIDALLGLTCRFGALPGFVRRESLNSSVMTWQAGRDNALTKDIWTLFMRAPQTIIRRLRREGDQDFINLVAGADARRLLTVKSEGGGAKYHGVLPAGYIQSYKADGLAASPRPPADMRLLVMHGEPKPPDLPEGHWARTAWEAS